MSGVFMSYARPDLETVRAFEQRLAARGVTVWRDQKSLYGGSRWPKALGEAIADNLAVLLFWSEKAAASEYVELEWCTALALRKQILPFLLDDTPLPKALRAIQGVDAADPATAVNAVLRLVEKEGREADQAHSDRVLEDLSQIVSSEPAEVLEAAKEVFDQRGWTVHGDVHITPVRPPSKQKKTLAERWQIWVALAVGVLTTITLAVQLPERLGSLGSPEDQDLTVGKLVIQPLAGWIRDETGDPLAGVQVSLPRFNLKDETDELGRFGFEVEADRERSVDLVARKAGYVTYESFATLGNTSFSFTMRRER